jgi:hypothetical protein
LKAGISNLTGIGGGFKEGRKALHTTEKDDKLIPLLRNEKAKRTICIQQMVECK